MTLDEWAEQNAPGLREDIQCHLDNAAPEDQARLILISVRQWAEQPRKSRLIKLDHCPCGGKSCLRCAP